jgi:hypothetical protein
MKLLTNFMSFTPTSSGQVSGFPIGNITDIEPMKRWHSNTQYEAWVKFQISSAIGNIFLNRCNFPHFHFQWNATDTWTAPTIDQGYDLVLDDAGNRKGWFDLPANGAGWVRIFIPTGYNFDDLTDSAKIGNVIIGTATTLPTVGDFAYSVARRYDRFESRAGAITKTALGRARHILQISVGDSLANIRSMPKDWTIGVVFADLGNAGESWLVYPPDSWDRPIRSVLDAALQFVLEEKP